MDIQIRTVPELRVAFEAKVVDQAQLVEWLPGAMSRVYGFAEQAGGWVPSTELPWLGRQDQQAEPVFIVIYEGNPNEGPTEITVASPVVASAADGATVRNLPAHAEAFAHLTRAEAEPPQIGSAYMTLEAWIGENGKENAGPPREIYYTDFFGAAQADIVCDLAWPVAGG